MSRPSHCICDEGFKANPNPRVLTCVRCDRFEESPLLDRRRVEDYFETLREMLESAGRIHKPDPSGQIDPEFEFFMRQAVQRLQQGARTYGPNAFIHDGRHLPQEAIEEMLDVANYSLMELVKSAPNDVDAVLLGQAMYHTFCGYQCIRGYQAAMSRR